MTATSSSALSSRRAVQASWLVILACSLWLRTGFPVAAIGDARFDDELFVTLAQHIAAGHWLGPYSELTLVKGVFYPIFIAAAFWAGIPLKIAEQLVYLAAAMLLAHKVNEAARGRVPGTVLLLLLAFDPVLFTPELARVIREGLYIGLSLGLVACLFTLTLPLCGRSREAVLRPCQGFLTGIIGGAFWLTREEGIWIVPAVVTMLAARVVALRMQHRAPGSGPSRSRRAALIAGSTAAAACVGFALMDVSDAGINRAVYGRAETVDVKATPFLKAYGAISRIAHDQWQPLVVFPVDARRRAYSVSLAARELEPSLDGPNGQNWARLGCTIIGLSKCPEILAPWFQWALRDAVANAGHYKSLPETNRFYDKLSSQLDDACRLRTIRCLPSRASLAPPFRFDYLRPTVDALPPLLGIVLQAGGLSIIPASSMGSPSEKEEFARFVGPIVRSASTPTVITGWVIGRSVPHLAIEILPGSHVNQFDVTQGTDLLLMRPGHVPVRFRLELDGDLSSAALTVTETSGSYRYAISTLIAQRSAKTADMWINIDQAVQMSIRRPETRRWEVMRAIVRSVGRVYAWLGPPLTVLGFAGVIASLVLRPTPTLGSPLFGLALGSIAAVCARLFLLAYLNATAIFAVSLLYASPAIPFVLVLEVTGTALLVTTLRARRSATPAL